MQWAERYKESNVTNCPHKRTFSSFAEASAFNKRSPYFLGGSKKREKMHVYRCNRCRQWHIGHSPQTRNDRIEKRRRRGYYGQGTRFTE